MKLLSIPQVAERLDCSRWHVYALIRAGLLTPRDISLPPTDGGPRRPKTRIADTDVDAYIESIARDVPKRAAS